jgi:N utilization substance protein B
VARQHTRFGARTNARSQALQLLFQAEATGRMVVDVLAGEYALSDGPLDSYAEQLAVGADSMLHELDAVLEMTSSNWSVRRMPAVDRNLLRLAVYEMLEVEDVDTAVVIDECVELAKAYGTDESSAFVNGVLGRLAARLAAGEDVVALAVAAVEEAEAAKAQAAEADEQPSDEEDEYEDDLEEGYEEDLEDAYYDDFDDYDGYDEDYPEE